MANVQILYGLGLGSLSAASPVVTTYGPSTGIVPKPAPAPIQTTTQAAGPALCLPVVGCLTPVKAVGLVAAAFLVYRYGWKRRR